MNKFTDSQLSDLLVSSGVSLDLGVLESVRAYIGLLSLWNKKISLTSIDRSEEIVKRHFGESFFASSVLSMRQGRLADVGSGAGFPGIPIKMLAPDLGLSLIESNTKKAAFLSEVVRKLDLKPVEVLNIRMEDIPETAEPFDFATARGVGDHLALLQWARRHLNASGKVVLFLGADDATVISRQRGWSWNQTNIPNSHRSVLLVGTQV